MYSYSENFGTTNNIRIRIRCKIDIRCNSVLEVTQVSQSQLVPRHQSHVPVVLGHVEVGRRLLVESLVPPHFDVVLGLGLLQLLVIVGLQLDQGPEDVLVLVTVLLTNQKSIFTVSTYQNSPGTLATPPPGPRQRRASSGPGTLRRCSPSTGPPAC